jgi:branched-chain amino acid transport system ATP-binding protein
VLEVRDLHVDFGAVPAVRGIDLDVAQGEAVAILGRNGAGKTTTLRALAGLVTPRTGRIRLDGSDVLDLPAERRVDLGVALVPEARGLFSRLTVGENLAMGAYHRAEWGRRRLAPDFDRVCAVFPRLGERFGQPASTLSGGEQQMLAVGRAIMGRPRLLLVDEPSLGLAPAAVDQLYRTFDVLKAEGLTLVVVEQHVEVALGFADRVYVLDKGRVALSGQGADLAVSMVGVYLSAVGEEGVYP